MPQRARTPLFIPRSTCRIHFHARYPADFEESRCLLSLCTTMVYTGAMPASKHVRRSVSLPVQVARQVDRLAKRRRLSDNRVLVELIEEGIEAQKQKEKAFFELAERFRSSNDPAETKNWATSWDDSSSVSNAADRNLVTAAGWHS